MKRLLVLALVCLAVISCNKEVDDDNDNIDSSSVGCKDISARNYDSSATINDHCLCDYEMPCDYTLITQNYDTTGDVRFILPNALTSNADGINDNWRPIFGQGIDSAHWSVYDRGLLIYQERTNNDTTILVLDSSWLTFDSIYNCSPAYQIYCCILCNYEDDYHPNSYHKYQFHIQFYSIHGDIIKAEGEFVDVSDNTCPDGSKRDIYCPNCLMTTPLGNSSALGNIVDAAIPNCIP